MFSMELTRVIIDGNVERATCRLAKLVPHHILNDVHRSFVWEYHRWFCPLRKNFHRKLCIIFLVADKRFIPGGNFRLCN